MNKPVSFSLAKLLAEKEFDKNEEVYKFYVKPRSKMFGTDEKGRYYPMKNTPKKLYTIGEHAALNSTSVYIAPTISDVVMWIYENHGIWIYTRPVLDEDGEWIFKGYVKLMNDFKAKEYQTKLLRKPTEAYEAAIEYTLTHLIK